MHWYIHIGCATLLTACNNLLEYKLDFSKCFYVHVKYVNQYLDNQVEVKNAHW